MLRSCFKDKTKRTFLQKCRTLAICQCACQVIILLADAVESWKARESCNVFRVLSSSMLFFQGCNLMAILIIYFDQPTAHGASELWSKLKISAALFLGFTGSAMIWWYTCSSREFLFQMVLIVIFVVSVAFVILLFAWDARNNIDVQLEVDFVTCVFIGNRIWSPRSVENEVLLDALYSVITRFVVGIVLPVTFSDSIESSKQEENGLKSAFI